MNNAIKKRLELTFQFIERKNKTLLPTQNLVARGKNPSTIMKNKDFI